MSVAPRPLRTAVIGYGLSGRVFHAPFLAASSAYSLDAIVTANPGRAEQAATDHPEARIVPGSAELFAGSEGLDLVVVATPPANHYVLAEAAIRHGLHVVVDKPFVPVSTQGEQLMAQARQAGVVLSVFQNRRWDSDFLTLSKLIRDGVLGKVHNFESRFERWKPEGLRDWKATADVAEGGGMLFDLGSHLIDQALTLFGPAMRVYGETARHTPGAGTDEDVFVSILHESGVRSRLTMNLISALPAPRFHVLGSSGAFTSWGLDGQEAALRAGVVPGSDGYGTEPEERWATVGTPGRTRKVPSERGAYTEFYRLLANAISHGGPVPVEPADALAAIRVIEEVHRQNQEG